MSLKHRHVTKKSSSSSLSSSSSRDSVKQNHVSYDDVIKGLEKEMGSMRGRDADIVGFFFFEVSLFITSNITTTITTHLRSFVSAMN